MRKLIRPNLSELKGKMVSEKPSQRKRTPPSYETNAENYYYLKQMTNKTPMVIVLNTGEIIKGTIEWYDRDCIKITRENAPNLLIFKHSIQYIYKDTQREE
ncbi:MAG: Hfq-like protein [Candidatus Aminicenantia bacterium]